MFRIFCEEMWLEYGSMHFTKRPPHFDWISNALDDPHFPWKEEIHDIRRYMRAEGMLEADVEDMETTYTEMDEASFFCGKCNTFFREECTCSDHDHNAKTCVRCGYEIGGDMHDSSLVYLCDACE